MADGHIRAVHDARTIRVYQAYGDAIADAALAHQTFVAPFRMTRMTWIKPSFLWMMYRSGWARRDPGQTRILAIDLDRSGFDWALANSCPTRIELGMSPSEWAAKSTCPVRVQWDPERDLLLRARPERTIQVGLRDEALKRYVEEWIVGISDVTSLAHTIGALVASGHLDEAADNLPDERLYDSRHTADRIGPT